MSVKTLLFVSKSFWKSRCDESKSFPNVIRQMTFATLSIKSVKDQNLFPTDLQSTAVAFLLAQRFFLQPAPDLRYTFAPLS